MNTKTSKKIGKIFLALYAATAIYAVLGYISSNEYKQSQYFISPFNATTK